MAKTQVTLVADTDVSPIDGTGMQGSQEVRESSESEPALQRGVATTIERAEELGRRWRERERTEGAVRWHSPFDARESRKLFATKGACQKHMNATAKARIAQAKLEGRPPESYSPQSFIVSPKRTIADFVMSKHQAFVAQEANIGEVHHIAKLARDDSKKIITSGILMGMPESQAIGMLNRLSDDELQRVAQQAYFRGKRRLYRAARDACAAKNLVVQV